MKTNYSINDFILITLFTFLLVHCSDSTVESPINNNLLSNGSFEFNGKPTLDGWRFGNEELVESVNEAPPGGGFWSLQLTADWAPTSGFAYILVPEVKNGDIVKLSAFVKTDGGNASIQLFYKDHVKMAITNDTVWTQLSVIDTLSLIQGDTLRVILSSPVTELIEYKQLFDLVRLDKIGVREN